MLPLIARDAELRDESKRFLRYALFLTIPLFFLFFYFFPQFDFKPYELPYQPPIEIVFPDEIIIPDEPRDIPQPVIPVEVSDEEAAEETDLDIAPNVFATTAEMPIVPHIAKHKTDEPEFYAFDEAPILIESIKPIYPEAARGVGIEGTVLLRLLIDEDGKVAEAEIMRSNVTSSMEKAAIDAALGYRFLPAKQRNVPVKAHVALPIIFKLN